MAVTVSSCMLADLGPKACSANSEDEGKFDKQAKNYGLANRCLSQAT